jgi:hypothetical protein
MVFLITSNTTKINGVNTTGLNDPARYNNMLSQTFNIEPNSEIAVESIKITRNGGVQLSSANNQFNIFLGDDMNACGTDLETSLGFPVPTFIRGGNETFSPYDLARGIKYGLLAGLGQHPNFVPIDTTFPKVELKNGSGEFTGFKYSFTQNICSTTATPIPAVAGQGGWVASTTEDLNAVISASGTEVVLKKEDPQELVGDLSVIGQKYPLNLANGSVVFRYNSSANGSAGDFWEVGLTRATLNDAQVSNDDGLLQTNCNMPFWYNRANNGRSGFANPKRFFDYSVADRGDGKLRIFDASFFGSDDDDEAVFKRREILYDGGTPKNSASFVAVKFVADNESVDVIFIKADGTEETIINNENASKVLNTKPIGVSNFYLFPKVNIYDPEVSASRIMVVEKYSGLNIPTPDYDTDVNLSFQYGGRKDSGVVNEPALLGNRMTGDLTYQDWWSWMMRVGGEGTCQLMEARDRFDMNLPDINPARMTINSSGGLNKNITIITSSDGLYNGRDTDVAGGYTREAGAQNIMGFETTPVQTINTYAGLGNGNLGVIESKTAPKMISNKSLFVRLPDLPIESFNTGKGSMSKILFHLPRFDNSGNEVGGLFFQPSQRIYIPLNNPNAIRMNNIKVELCNIDETNDNVDLVGQTIICFDIRKR